MVFATVVGLAVYILKPVFNFSGFVVLTNCSDDAHRSPDLVSLC